MHFGPINTVRRLSTMDSAHWKTELFPVADRIEALATFERFSERRANEFEREVMLANGLRGTKDELMEAFAKATREETQRLYWRIKEIKNRANNPTPLPQPPPANFRSIGGDNINPMWNYIQQQNAAVAAHKQQMAAYDERDRLIQQENAKYVLGGRQMGLGQAAILALATPEEIAAAAAAKKLAAQREQQRIYLNQSNAVRYNQELAAKGDEYGLLRMAERYRDGDGVEKDLTKAKEYFNKAIAVGSTTAAEELKKLNDAVEK